MSTNELPANPAAGKALIDPKGDSGSQYATNFVGEGIERWLFISKVSQGEVIKGDKARNLTIKLVFWYVKESEFVNDDTGEIRPGIRTVLVDDEGRCYAFASDGVYNGLRLIVHTFGPGPYVADPVRIIVREGQSKGRKRYYWIEPDYDYYKNK